MKTKLMIAFPRQAHIYSNCVISCFKCNVRRRNMPFNQFYRSEALKRYDIKYPLIHIINEKNKIVFDKLKYNIRWVITSVPPVS